MKDANDLRTVFAYNDTLDRVTNVTRGRTLITYSYPFDAGSASTKIVTKTQFSSGSWQVAERVFDGLGRHTQSRSSKDGADCGTTASNCVVTLQTLDGLGRTVESFNAVSGAIPTACSGTTPCVRTVYDRLGRVTTITHQDGLSTSMEYSFLNSSMQPEATLSATVNDPASVRRRTSTDAFGRIVRVLESPDAAQQYSTAYTFDALDNLTSVSQGSSGAQNARVFTYDSVSWLLESDQPESGITKYVYDANGNLEEKQTSAGTVKARISYDALNRPLKRSYPGLDASLNPDVHFEYDADLRPSTETRQNYPNGRLVRVRTAPPNQPASLTNAYTFQLFDAEGNVLRSSQRTGSQDYDFQYNYDLAGQLETTTYPSGRTVANTRNHLGQITEVKSGTRSMAKNIEYHPSGALEKLEYGNSLREKTTFNSRLQPTNISLGTATAPAEAGSFTFGYDGVPCNSPSLWRNNGNVVTQTISGAGASFTETYGYDGVNRIRCVSEGTAAGASWQQVYNYDAFGNRWVETNTLPNRSPLTPALAADIDAAHNRIRTTPTGNRYDSDGNLTRLAGRP